MLTIISILLFAFILFFIFLFGKRYYDGIGLTKIEEEEEEEENKEDDTKSNFYDIVNRDSYFSDEVVDCKETIAGYEECVTVGQDLVTVLQHPMNGGRACTEKVCQGVHVHDCRARGKEREVFIQRRSDNKFLNIDFKPCLQYVFDWTCQYENWYTEPPCPQTEYNCTWPQIYPAIRAENAEHRDPSAWDVLLKWEDYNVTGSATKWKLKILPIDTLAESFDDRRDSFQLYTTVHIPEWNFGPHTFHVNKEGINELSCVTTPQPTPTPPPNPCEQPESLSSKFCNVPQKITFREDSKWHSELGAWYELSEKTDVFLKYELHDSSGVRNPKSGITFTASGVDGEGQPIMRLNVNDTGEGDEPHFFVIKDYWSTSDKFESDEQVSSWSKIQLFTKDGEQEILQAEFYVPDLFGKDVSWPPPPWPPPQKTCDYKVSYSEYKFKKHVSEGSEGINLLCADDNTQMIVYEPKWDCTCKDNDNCLPEEVERRENDQICPVEQKECGEDYKKCTSYEEFFPYHGNKLDYDLGKCVPKTQFLNKISELTSEGNSKWSSEFTDIVTKRCGQSFDCTKPFSPSTPGISFFNQRDLDKQQGHMINQFMDKNYPDANFDDLPVNTKGPVYEIVRKFQDDEMKPITYSDACTSKTE